MEQKKYERILIPTFYVAKKANLIKKQRLLFNQRKKLLKITTFAKKVDIFIELRPTISMRLYLYQKVYDLSRSKNEQKSNAYKLQNLLNGFCNFKDYSFWLCTQNKINLGLIQYKKKHKSTI